MIGEREPTTYKLWFVQFGHAIPSSAKENPPDIECHASSVAEVLELLVRGEIEFPHRSWGGSWPSDSGIFVSADDRRIFQLCTFGDVREV